MERENFGIKYSKYERTNKHDIGCMIYSDTCKDRTFMISELSGISVLDVERSLYIDYDIYDLLDSSIHLNGYLIAYDIFNNFIGMNNKDLFFKDLNNIILGNISIDDFINKYGKSDICRINDCIIKCKV